MPEEVKLEVLQKTQKSLGKYVKKPPLSEKLLKKPPFRFLLDVVRAVITETGFLHGLYTPDELNSENVKEKDAKIAFLTKLIDAVKTLTKTELAVRPGKIVAGLEPTETNILLQTIAKAIDRKVDSSQYVNQIKSGQVPSDMKKVKSRDKIEKTSKQEPKIKSTKSKTSINEKTEKATVVRNSKSREKLAEETTPKSSDRTQSKRSITDPKREKEKPKTDTTKRKPKDGQKMKPKSEKIEEAPKVEDLIEITGEDPQVVEETPKKPQEPENKDSGISSENITPVIDNPPTPSRRLPSAARPKSARPKSGESKENSRPKSTLLRPPSVRPSSARPGAPRLRPDSAIPARELVPMGKINVIVENADKDDDDEEETVVIQQGGAVVEDAPAAPLVDDLGDNKGHLVEQILEQISDGDGDRIRAKVDIDWRADSGTKESANKEVNNLKNLIQTLTKTVNPLGKLLNYLHEDFDAMQAELETWKGTKKQLFMDISKQKRAALELNKPLVGQLENLEQDIEKIQQEILNTRSNILKNDQRIKELLDK